MLEALTNTSDSYAKIVKLIPSFNEMDQKRKTAHTPFVVIRNEVPRKVKHIGVFYLNQSNVKPIEY